MQYEAEVKNYVRNKQLKKESVKNNSTSESYTRFFLIAIIGMFISRVYFNVGLSFIDNIAPFGILYVISVSRKHVREGIVALAATIVGYVSISTVISETPIFIVSSIFIVAINFLIKNKKSEVIFLVDLFVFSTLVILNGIFLLKQDIAGVLIVTALSTGILIPLHYIISFGYKCFSDFKFESYISNDEIISIEIFISVVLVGIGNIGIFGVEFRNIFAVFFVFFASYIGRGNIGTTSGVIVGTVFGLITGKLYFYITVFAIGSLFVSMFKETGRLVSYIAFNVSVVFIATYTGNLNNLFIAEILIGSTVVMFVPNAFLEKIRLEFDSDNKKEEDGEKHFNKIKSELMNRLSDFTGVLGAMSGTLDNMVENEKLVYQNKGDELVDNLADRVCRNCDYKSTCWKREVNETYNSFRELIQSYEEGSFSFPDHLKRKCLKEASLVRETEEIVGKHIADEMLKKRLAEGRKMLASHIGSMSDTISEIVEDFSSEVSLNLEAEKVIKKALLRNNVKFDYLIAYNDKDGRLNIKIEMENCGGCNYCVKGMLPIINSTIGRKMSVTDNCVISATTGLCEIHIKEATKFYVDSGVAISAKSGEKYTGDSYSFSQTNDGHHMVLLCDGMGSGARAGEESKIAVEMVEKFSESGFSEKTAINTINSIMNIKFAEEEKFSTLDMHKINLYDGTAKFLKVGAMESFVKRGSKIEILDSKTLPFGVLDTPDIDEKDYKLRAGDFVIAISDGILDNAKNGDLDNSWLVKFLESSTQRDPSALASRILDIAKGFNNGKAKDDMTVVVSKVYSIKQ